MLQMVYDGVETREMLRLTPEPPLSDDEYFDFCAANPDLRIERTAEGEIEITAPPGLESSYRNSELTMQLCAWAKRDGRGISLDSNAEFLLRDGSARSPDASWIHRSKLAPLTRKQKQKRKFSHLCPDFVIELMSPSDRLSRQQTKMQQWMDNGVLLGWLIDADRRTVYVYRPDGEVEKVVERKKLRGETPVDGFVLDLTSIFDSPL